MGYIYIHTYIYIHKHVCDMYEYVYIYMHTHITVWHWWERRELRKRYTMLSIKAVLCLSPCILPLRPFPLGLCNQRWPFSHSFPKRLIPAGILCGCESQRPCVNKVLWRKNTTYSSFSMTSVHGRAEEASRHLGFLVTLNIFSTYPFWIILLCRPAHIHLCRFCLCTSPRWERHCSFGCLQFHGFRFLNASDQIQTHLPDVQCSHFSISLPQVEL